jgi:integrase
MIPKPYRLHHTTAPTPYKMAATNGVYVVNIRGGADHKVFRRYCGTKDYDEALCMADIYAELDAKNNTTMIDRLCLSKGEDALSLHDLFQWYLRAIEITDGDEGERRDLSSAVAKALRNMAGAAQEKENEALAQSLFPLIDQWENEKDRELRPKSRYADQCRRMFELPGFSATLDNFTQDACRTLVYSLEKSKDGKLVSVHTETKKKNLAALRAIAKYLKVKGLLPGGNPLAEHNCIEFSYTEDELDAKDEIENYTEAQVRDMVTELQRTDVDNPAPPYMAASVALMFSTALEISAVRRVYQQHFDRECESVVAHGTKRAHRRKGKRPSALISLPWCQEIVAAYVATLAPFEQFIPKDEPGQKGREERQTYQWFHEARERAGVPLFKLPLHSFRHSFAVYWILERHILEGQCLPLDTAWLRDQLGHKEDSLTLFKVYGRIIKESKLDAKKAWLREQARKAATTPQTPYSEG